MYEKNTKFFFLLLKKREKIYFLNVFNVPVYIILFLRHYLKTEIHDNRIERIALD